MDLTLKSTFRFQGIFKQHIDAIAGYHSDLNTYASFCHRLASSFPKNGIATCSWEVQIRQGEHKTCTRQNTMSASSSSTCSLSSASSTTSLCTTFSSNNSSSSSSRRRQRGLAEKSKSCPRALLRTAKPIRSSFRSTNSNVATTRKEVSFGRTQVRKYPIILGDHPDCAFGPPVSETTKHKRLEKSGLPRSHCRRFDLQMTIGWAYIKSKDVSVETYEASHRKGRTLQRMNIPPDARWDLMLRCGVQKIDIVDVLHTVHAAQKQRNRTIALLPFTKLEEAGRSLSRRLGNKKKDIDLLLPRQSNNNNKGGDVVVKAPQKQRRRRENGNNPPRPLRAMIFASKSA